MTALRLRANDALDVVLRRRAAFGPPRRLWPEGITDFPAQGRDQVNHMIALAKLSPEARLIDVQCGSGLRANALHDWLGPGALYDGLDTDESLIDWCDSAYAQRMDFEFHHHPNLDAQLPFSDETKDFVVLWDLFPQLDAAIVAHLVSEAARVLLPKGTLFIGAYLLDAHALVQLENGGAEIAFERREAAGGQAPDGRRAQDEEWLLDRIAEAGFKKVGIRHGTWSGRHDGRSPLDILVATK